MANKFDDLSESMLNSVMCTDTCPCYRTIPDRGHAEIGHENTEHEKSAFERYQSLGEDYVNMYARTLEHDPRILTGLYKPFVWSIDRSKSYESFMECYKDYEAKKKAGNDAIDLEELFSTKTYVDEKDRRNGNGYTMPERIEDLEIYLGIEDMFDCSGMCRPSLFYFGKNITEDAFP